MYKKGLYAIAALVGIFLLGLIGYIIILFLGNYVIDEKKIVMDSATRLVDENGDELTKLYVKNRDLVSIDKIPKHE